MTTMNIAYRLTVYAPRSVDVTEATVLTPAAGAPHSDMFKVATLEGITGFKPYLGMPTGRRGKIAPLTGTTDIGTLNVDIYDVALTPGVNSARWMSAFFGDTAGHYKFSGLKCFMEESLDGGVTWAAFWTGYISTVALSGALMYTVTIRDLFWDLSKLPVFLSQPHSSVSYAARMSLCPVGLVGSPYLTQLPVQPFNGVVASPVVVGGTTALGLNGAALAAVNVVPDNYFYGSGTNILTADVYGLMPAGSIIDGALGAGSRPGAHPNFQVSSPLRAHLTWNSGANSGDFLVGLILQNGYVNAPLGDGSHPSSIHKAISSVVLQALPDTTDAGYSALPANLTAVTMYLFADIGFVKGNGLYLNSTHPLTILQDMLGGKFSPVYRSPEKLPAGKSYGDVKRSFSTNISSASIPNLPLASFVIADSNSPKTIRALEWITKNICTPYNVALIQTAAGQIQVVDLSPPNTLAGAVTITDADIDLAAPVTWQHDRDMAITRGDGSVWQDLPLQLGKLISDSSTYPKISAGALDPIEHPLVVLYPGFGDFGENPFKVDGTGYRSMDGTSLSLGGSGQFGYVAARLKQRLDDAQRPFAYGQIATTIMCRRTANVASLLQGQVAQVQLTKMPDPFTNLRGGQRVVRVIERSEMGPRIQFSVLDLGNSSVANQPSIGNPALGPDVQNSATVSVTLDGQSDPVQVQYMLTTTAVAVHPGDTDPGWQAYPLNPVRSTQTITLTNVAGSGRLWVRGRSVPDQNGTSLSLPSAWFYTALLDITVLPAPTALGAGDRTANSAALTWTNTATDLLIEVLLASPTSDPLTRVATLLAGSNTYTLAGLVASTQYKAAVQYRTQSGVVSAQSTVIFTTTSTQTTPGSGGGTGGGGGPRRIFR